MDTPISYFPIDQHASLFPMDSAYKYGFEVFCVDFHVSHESSYVKKRSLKIKHSKKTGFIMKPSNRFYVHKVIDEMLMHESHDFFLQNVILYIKYIWIIKTCRYNQFYINIYIYIYTIMGFPGGASGKEPACQCRRHKRCGFDPWVGKISWKRAIRIP